MNFHTASVVKDHETWEEVASRKGHKPHLIDVCDLGDHLSLTAAFPFTRIPFFHLDLSQDYVLRRGHALCIQILLVVWKPTSLFQTFHFHQVEGSGDGSR